MAGNKINKNGKNMKKTQLTNQQQIFNKMVEIICKKFEVEAKDVSMDLSFDAGADKEHPGLGADSLDRVELFMDFETAFGVTIEDKEAEKVHTVGDVVRLVVKLGGKVKQDIENKNLVATGRIKGQQNNNLPDPTLSQLLQMPLGEVLTLVRQHTR